MQGCERGVSSHLVYEHQASRLESLGDQHTPSGSQELQFAFTRTQSPFFRVNPIRFKSRETVESLTLILHTLSRNCVAFLRAWRSGAAPSQPPAAFLRSGLSWVGIRASSWGRASVPRRPSWRSA